MFVDTISSLSNASRIAHAGLPFANPMSETDVDRAIAALPLGMDPAIVDLGCGGGSLLRRAVDRHPGARGLGVDQDPEAIREATQSPGDRNIRFEQGDAAGVGGRFDAAINVAASHVFGGFPVALERLRELAPVVLYGEGFWRRTPTPRFLAALGDASEDELADFDGLRRAVDAAGFDVVDAVTAADADWAAYEEGLAGNAERHGGTEALAYGRRIRDRRALPGGTDTLGFALLVLRLR